MKKNLLVLLLLMGCALLFQAALSQAQHGHGSGSSPAMEVREVLTGGVKVSFQIMPNEEHRKALKSMKMKDDVEPGSTHNIAVVCTDEKTGKPITDAAVSMKVIDPAKKDQIKNMKYEAKMKSYDAYFSLKDKGKYQIMVLLKRGEQKLAAGIYYEME